jgi:diguanylate cyclase (GGDEF)-like protein
MFRERLMTLLANGHGEVEPAAVMLINLARFKAINDSLGHIVGDKLLRVVADRIRSALGPDGFAARLRGEEFAVIQPCESVRSVVAVAERLIDLLGRSYVLDGHLLTIGASIGVAMIPVDGLTAEQVQRNANLALQQAKLVGRGCCRFFVSAMDEAVQERRSLEIDLRRALALEELALVYQPQYNVATKRITGFETLLRWHHP